MHNSLRRREGRTIKSNRIPVGAPLIFTVFAVVMLASFAALALSTANADLVLTERAQRAMTEYYDLDRQAQARLDSLKEGESTSFTLHGETMTLRVSAKMENNAIKITEHRADAITSGEYGGGILDLWDGN